MNCIATKYINILVEFFFIYAANFTTVIILYKTYVSFKLWILTRLYKGLNGSIWFYITSQCWTYKSFIDVIGWHQNSSGAWIVGLLTFVEKSLIWKLMRSSHWDRPSKIGPSLYIWIICYSMNMHVCNFQVSHAQYLVLTYEFWNLVDFWNHQLTYGNPITDPVNSTWRTLFALIRKSNYNCHRAPYGVI